MLIRVSCVLTSHASRGGAFIRFTVQINICRKNIKKKLVEDQIMKKKNISPKSTYLTLRSDKIMKKILNWIITVIVILKLLYMCTY